MSKNGSNMFCIRVHGCLNESKKNSGITFHKFPSIQREALRKRSAKMGPYKDHMEIQLGEKSISRAMNIYEKPDDNSGNVIIN